jgi:hypothetical protein
MLIDDEYFDENVNIELKKPKKDTKTKFNFSGEFKNDFNIIDLDNKIKNFLKNQSTEKYELRIKVINELLSEKIKVIDRKILTKEKDHLVKKIQDIKNNVKYNEYVKLSKSLIDEYKQFKIIPTKAFSKETDEIVNKRLDIIHIYLDLAKKFVKINIKQILEKNPHITCIDCNNIINTSTDEDRIICDNCNCIIYTSTLQIPKESNSKTISCDDSLDSFKTTLRKFQCLQTENEKPKPIVYEKLDKYFTSINCKTGAEIREMPLINGRRGNYTIKMLLEALNKIKENSHYEDVYYISYEYWGWNPPQITQYESTIIDHYIKTQKVYNEMSKEERGRSSSLGTQFRLFKHLQLVGYPCERKDFKISNENESRILHNKLWKSMCEKVEDPNIYFIP